MAEELVDDIVIAKCPMCDEVFDPEDYKIVECSVCEEKGSTACCITQGEGTPCINCEDTGIDDEIYDLDDTPF